MSLGSRGSRWMSKIRRLLIGRIEFLLARSTTSSALHTVFGRLAIRPARPSTAPHAKRAAPGRIRDDKPISRAGSALSLSHSELPKSLTVLFEIRGRVVEDFVLL